MVGIMIVSHGEMANGLVDAMQMITGSQEQVAAISLQESDSPEDLSGRIDEMLPSIDDGDGVLIMVDLFGATPFNASLRLYLELNRKIEIVTGANLPMLMETVVFREGNDLKSVFDCAYQAGRDGIKPLPESIKKNLQ